MTGRFVRGEAIGAGGLADVYRGVDTLTGEEVALKVLREPSRSRAHRERFLREGRLLQRLKLPGLPRCVSVLPGPEPTLALELLTGVTLATRLKQGPLPAEEAVSVAEQLLTTLEAVHAAGVVHRDIKAGNVWLHDDGRAMLLDLGLAADREEPRSAQVGDVMGTYAYMSPEQIAGGETDHRSDLYSLGVTLYEAVSGRRPYKAAGVAGYLRAHREGQAQPVAEVAPGLPQRLVDLIQRLLARDPAARPESASVALALLAGQPSVAGELAPAPLVGRHGPLGALQAVLDAGAAVQLVGEAGMGKARLVRLLWDMARRSDTTVVAVRCVEERDPCLELLRELRPDSPTPTGSMAGAARAALADAVARGAHVVVVEGADLVPPASRRELASALAVAGAGLVVVAERPISELPGRSVELRPLTVDEVEALARGMLKGTPPPGLAQRLHRLAGGAPRGVTALVRDLHRRRVLVPDVEPGPGGELTWSLVGPAVLRPEVALSRELLLRLRRLGDGARAVLEVLAVAGEPVQEDVLASAVGGGPAVEGVAELARAGIAVASEGSTRLPVPATAELVLAELPAFRRRATHRALAEAFAVELPPGALRESLLRRHRALGAPPSEAPDALVDLGTWYVQQGRFQAALEVLDRATVDEHLDWRATVDCARGRGRALLGLGRPGDAAAAFEAARRLAEEQGDKARAWTAAMGLAKVHEVFGDRATAKDLVDSLLGEEGLPRALAWRAHLVAARVGAAQGDLEGAEGHLDAIDAESARGLVAWARGELLLRRGSAAEAAALLDGAADGLGVRGRGLERALCVAAAARAHLRTGHVDEALVRVERLRRGLGEQGLHRLTPLAGVELAAVHLASHDLEAAERLVVAHRPALSDACELPVRLWAYDVAVLVRAARGDRPGALELARRAVPLAERAGEEGHRAFHLGLEAAFTGQRALLQDALDSLDDAGDVWRLACLRRTSGAVSGDADLLDGAVEPARRSGDLHLLLEALHAAGGAAEVDEAAAVARRLLAGTPEPLRQHLAGAPAVRWALGSRW